MANKFGSVADTALQLQSKSSVCAAKNQEINGFQMRHVSRSRSWEDCPCGWTFPTQCKRHLTHSTHLSLLLSAWQRGRYANVLQADVPKGFWLQRGSVSRGDSRGHSTLHLHVSLTHCVVSKRSPKLSVLALSNPGKHLLLHAGEEMNSRNIPSCKNIPMNTVFWFISATDWGRGD